MTSSYRPTSPRLSIEIPAELPIAERRTEIVEAVRAHPVVVVCGETGSGKSTQLPKLCIEAGRGRHGLIGHTQPRRIAARSIAARIAEELGTKVGGLVGSKVRFQDRTSRDAIIKVMTDGILLAETQSDRLLEAYDTIIIDEAHERSLNIDFLLGYLKRLLVRRPDLKVIVTSATIDPDRFSRHFGDAPVIEVSGRTYPVEVRYRPLATDDPDERDRDVTGAIVAAVDELFDPASGLGGDVLVFLAGEREIREAAEALRKHHHPGRTEVLPLFARLSAAEQNRVFERHSGTRRIVLATNVAETSLTVPGIRGVIDTGLARIVRYSARAKVQRLPIEAISQASAIQRTGRCGRVAAGVCIRLYAEDDFERRDDFTPPEIMRTNLASAILRMKSLGLGDVRTFPFVEAPQRAMIRDGFDTLRELGAIDPREELTSLGRRLAHIPVDPRIGRMLLAAADEDCLREVLVIASALEIPDPRERPFERRDAADTAHARFADPESDFQSLLNLWAYYHEQKRHLSWNKLRKCCRDEFLSFVRMREWHDLHGQLREIVLGGRVLERSATLNEEPADSAQIHRAVIAGLLGNVGVREDRSEYRGARDTRFYIFPGSGLFTAPPKWIVSSEIVETTRRYARGNARVQPEWIERMGAHLIQHRYGEPWWDADRGQAIVEERAILLGLELSRRRRPFGQVDPEEGRRLFIHHALVEDDWTCAAPPVEHNRVVVAEVRAREAKRRVRDVLVENEQRFDFFDERLPADIWSQAGFERWLRGAIRGDAGVLRLTERDLIRPDANFADADTFPDTLTAGDAQWPLVYHLDPGSEDDGVTLIVPIEHLEQIDAARLAWLVPGLLEEKITAMMRALPKAWRLSFVPVPEWAVRCRGAIEFGRGSLPERLSVTLAALGGANVPVDLWDEEPIERHLRMNVRVVDRNGGVMAEGRHLETLRRGLREASRAAVDQIAGSSFGRDGITDWDFGPLEEVVTIKGSGRSITGYPILVDRGDSVALTLADSIERARDEGRAGMRRLFALRCADEIGSQLDLLPGIDQARLYGRSLPPAWRSRSIDESLTLRTVDQVFLASDEWVRDADAFAVQLERGWSELWSTACVVASIFEKILSAHHELQMALTTWDKPVWQKTVRDVRHQVTRLFEEDPLVDAPWGWLHQLPRYLEGARLRLERLPGGGHERDARRAEAITVLEEQFAERRADHHERGIRDRALADYRWLLEEWRIVQFAQDLGTAVSVSERRLAEQWARVRG